jgi:hypothetical protein
LLKKKKDETLHHNKSLFYPTIKTCGQFVVFLHEGNVHPGKVISFNGENVHNFRHGEKSEVVEVARAVRCS